MVSTLTDQVSLGQIGGPVWGPHYSDLQTIVQKHVASIASNEAAARIALTQAASEVKGLLGY